MPLEVRPRTCISELVPDPDSASTTSPPCGFDPRVQHVGLALSLIVTHLQCKPSLDPWMLLTRS